MLGMQWGDEGKGKIVDILARQYDIVARAQVAPAFVDLPSRDYEMLFLPLDSDILCARPDLGLPCALSAIEQVAGVCSLALHVAPTA